MKKTRIILSTFLIVTLSFGVMIFVSCNKGKTKYNDSTLIHPCDNVICLNGGTCTDGLCYCPQGFEGPKCATKWSDKFIGTYIADDACDTTAGYYNAIINADPDYSYKLRLTNVGLACAGATLNAIINPEKTSFTIPIQHVCGDLYLSGNGNLNGKYVNISLTARDTIAHVSNQCSIVLNKQ